MENYVALCTICSTSLLSPAGNQIRAKLLQTPCQHVFHRSCLKTSFRRSPSQHQCPNCTRPVSWNEVRVWQEPRKTFHDRQSKLKSDSAGSSVPSLNEEIRRKKAEEFVKKRRAQKSDQTLLEEVQKRRILEKQRLLALKRQRAGIKNKMASGKEKRCRQKFFKIICLSFLSVVLLVYLSIGAYSTIKKVHSRMDDTVESTAMFCFEKLGEVQKMFKVVKSILAELKEAQKIQYPNQSLLTKMKEGFKKVEKLQGQIELAQEEVRSVRIPKMKKKWEETQQRFMMVMGSYTGNGWSRNKLNSKENKLWMQKMQKTIMDRFGLEKVY